VKGLLKHVKTVEATTGSYADLLLKIRDPKTGVPLATPCSTSHCFH
jgi:hypothetical protein